jgi:hypothetical protein
MTETITQIIAELLETEGICAYAQMGHIKITRLSIPTIMIILVDDKLYVRPWGCAENDNNTIIDLADPNFIKKLIEAIARL